VFLSADITVYLYWHNAWNYQTSGLH